MYEKENAFYETNLKRFRREYPGKELVIVGDKLVAVYDDVGTAYRETIKTYSPGTFTIKQVREHPELVRIPMFIEGTIN